jgi:hypothetical protein
VKRYKSTTILGGGPPGKIVQCQSFDTWRWKILIYFFPIDCAENLIRVVESENMQHFSEFINKFPECDPDPEALYEEAPNIAKQVKVRIPN